jgi:hypothetical protein
MTVLTGLLILAAVLVAVALAVLATVAAAAEIIPPWLGRGEDALNATASTPGPQLLRGRRSEATPHARLIADPRRCVRTEYPRGSV